jgi:hypothetical protein
MKKHIRIVNPADGMPVTSAHNAKRYVAQGRADWEIYGVSIALRELDYRTQAANRTAGGLRTRIRERGATFACCWASWRQRGAQHPEPGYLDIQASYSCPNKLCGVFHGGQYPQGLPTVASVGAPLA